MVKGEANKWCLLKKFTSFAEAPALSPQPCTDHRNTHMPSKKSGWCLDLEGLSTLVNNSFFLSPTSLLAHFHSTGPSSFFIVFMATNLMG
jgi:hypothetical protein